MRGAARSNLFLSGGGRRAAVLRPSLTHRAAPIRIGGLQLNLISSSAGSARRPFHASTRALWAVASTDGDDDNANETPIETEQARIDAAFEEKERSEAYDRWVEAVRGQLKKIEERVLGGSSTAAVPATEDISNLAELFLSSPRMTTVSRTSLEPKRRGLITFENESRKPTQMPYIMLDPQWYQRTSEEERLQQVLAWRPFTARAVAADQADSQFKENPFRNKSQAYSGRVVTEEFRRNRLDTYLREELVNKRKVYTNVGKEDKKDVTLDEMKQAFRANLAMVEHISGEELAEEVAEPEVTKADKFIKPPGFVSATDMLKFSEEKLQADLDKLMKKAKKCVFCRPSAQRPVLDPLNVALLAMFMTPGGDIVGRRHNGNCRRHQRKLATTIKRAKHMGVFSYKYGGFTIYSPFQEPPETFAEDDGEEGEEFGMDDDEDDDDYDDEMEADEREH